MNKNQTELLSIRTLLALTLADVDVKLLRKDDQIEIKEGLFSPTEIQIQLHKSGIDMLKVLSDFGYDIDKPLNND
jgi:hypothetical protein